MSRYTKMFGTIEDAARTLYESDIWLDTICGEDCPRRTVECEDVRARCVMESAEAIEEWLRGDDGKEVLEETYRILEG